MASQSEEEQNTIQAGSSSPGDTTLGSQDPPASEGSSDSCTETLPDASETLSDAAASSTRKRKKKFSRNSSSEERAAAVELLREAEEIELTFERYGINFYSKYCAPSELSRTTVMTRVHPVSATKLFNDPSANQDKDDQAVEIPQANIPVLTLIQRFGSGASNDDEFICDFFHANARPGGPNDAPDETKGGLVVKLLDMDFVPPRDQTFWKFQMALECHAFRLARSLQGSCVPHFAGLFRHGTLYCLVYEDAGNFLRDQRRERKKEVVEVFQALYDVGVGPRDNEPCWLRRGLDGRLKVASFWDVSTVENIHSSEIELSRNVRGRTPTAEEAFEDLKNQRMKDLRQYGV